MNKEVQDIDNKRQLANEHDIEDSMIHSNFITLEYVENNMFDVN